MNYQKRKSGAGFSSLKDVLQEVLTRHAATRPLSVETKIWEFWHQAVGEEIHRKTEIRNFRNGILFVETRQAAWTTELQYRSETIRKRLNQLIGQDLIQQIQFRLGRPRSGE